MEHWINPCNIKYYDVEGAFEKLKCLDWKQSNKSIHVGDEVYIYIGKPVQAIKYRCKVNKVNIDGIEIDDSEFVRDGEPYETYRNHMEIELVEKYDVFRYSLEVLRKKGLKGNIQGPRRANGLLD